MCSRVLPGANMFVAWHLNFERKIQRLRGAESEAGSDVEAQRRLMVHQGHRQHCSLCADGHLVRRELTVLRTDGCATATR